MSARYASCLYKSRTRSAAVLFISAGFGLAASWLPALAAGGVSERLLIEPSIAVQRAAFENNPLYKQFGFPFHPYASVCPVQRPGFVRCMAKVLVDDRGVPLPSDPRRKPAGYTPADLLSAYNLSGTASGLPTIGVVDAYGDPDAYGDLKAYSNKFNIPVLPKCDGAVKDSSVPCFQAVDGKGGDKLPKKTDWAEEISLDLDVAHAICQNCSILLVEAKSNNISDMFPAENTAAALGATVISNSWGGPEFSNESQLDAEYFNHPGVAITASTGDAGYGLQYPATAGGVTAVGGTTLLLKKNGSYQSETAWSGAGSGCSQYEAKPSWQPVLGGCDTRTVADVSFDADSTTGVAVYDSVGCTGAKNTCWYVHGGTSVGAPAIAAIYALAGNVTPSIPANALPYQNGSKKNLHDITSGSTGVCGGSYLCTALVGYDGPTGLGTPNGVGAF
jgi:subtilase family serine protease